MMATAAPTLRPSSAPESPAKITPGVLMSRAATEVFALRRADEAGADRAKAGFQTGHGGRRR